MKAGIAVVIRADVDHNNMSSLSSLYTEKDSRPFYRCAISKNRMEVFLQNLTFDNKVTRRQRQETDKLAANREMWDLFEANLRRYYVPSDSLIVDEQLYSFRGYTPGRAYKPMKPAKYGVKIFWLCDAKNGFALKPFLYSRRDGNRPAGLAKNICSKVD